jgi:hypothetical protein
MSSASVQVGRRAFSRIAAGLSASLLLHDVTTWRTVLAGMTYEVTAPCFRETYWKIQCDDTTPKH